MRTIKENKKKKENEKKENEKEKRQKKKKKISGRQCLGSHPLLTSTPNLNEEENEGNRRKRAAAGFVAIYFTTVNDSTIGFRRRTGFEVKNRNDSTTVNDEEI